MYKKIKSEITQPDMILYSNIVYSNKFNDFLQTTIPLEVNIIRPFYQLRSWEKRPLLIWMSGGAFRNSTPMRNIPEMTEYAKQGFVVACIRYRTSSESVFPAPLEDIKTAIRFLKYHHETYGIDPDKVIIAGHSAGAYLAIMAAVTGGTGLFETAEWNGCSSTVNGAVSISGGDMFLENVETQVPGREINPLDLLMGCDLEKHPEKKRVASAANYLSKDTAPILMIHGECDEMISIDGSKAFYERLISAGVRADFYEVEGEGHGSLGLRQPTIHKIVVDFIEDIFK
ncbi:alpha/beta hydrolase fold domain-containing protein [Clostridium sp. MCC353]|uniref:alpha/beta hydrolase n=1 Tax=Clostridium sp. MCC353 TaxID=2592646 RepID=UPI001C02ABC3|nr:alpha/beta hydrolase [Clostridium sp. MCC353]MBT9776601.1 alpha/beta hydrolase fold domain-containing protein [Clostridium sp. MCC353]